MANRAKKPPLDASIERFIDKMKGNIQSASITGSYARYIARDALNYFNHAVENVGQRTASSQPG